jgi:hypothetical protein
MKTNKVLIGGVVGAIVFFLLGWAVYGLLLMDYMTENTNQCMMVPEEDMNLLALFAGNLALTMLLALVLNWMDVTSMMNGAKVGAVVGLLIALYIDLMFYSMSTMFSNMTAMFIDIAVFTIMSAITGAIMAKVMNMGKKAA